MRSTKTTTTQTRTIAANSRTTFERCTFRLPRIWLIRERQAWSGVLKSPRHQSKRENQQRPKQKVITTATAIKAERYGHRIAIDQGITTQIYDRNSRTTGCTESELEMHVQEWRRTRAKRVYGRHVCSIRVEPQVPLVNVCNPLPVNYGEDHRGHKPSTVPDKPQRFVVCKEWVLIPPLVIYHEEGEDIRCDQVCVRKSLSTWRRSSPFQLLGQLLLASLEILWHVVGEVPISNRSAGSNLQNRNKVELKKHIYSLPVRLRQRTCITWPNSCSLVCLLYLLEVAMCKTSSWKKERVVTGQRAQEEVVQQCKASARNWGCEIHTEPE